VPRTGALALALLGLGEPETAFAIDLPGEVSSAGGRRSIPITPVDDEWSESPRHTDSIRLTGDYGIDLTVDYQDSTGRKETVKSFHRLTILPDGFEIRSDGQSTKFPLNGRMSKRFENPSRSTMTNCFTLSTSSQIALECTIASKHENCVGDFVWKFVVQFNPAGECINVTTAQHGGHDCGEEKDRAGFRSTAFVCEKLGP
jgi:hypothetical protein